MLRGKISGACVTGPNGAVKDLDIWLSGATAVAWQALMRVMMGIELAPYEPIEPYASHHAGGPHSVAAECYTAAHRLDECIPKHVTGILLYLTRTHLQLAAHSGKSQPILPTHLTRDSS
ncbi:hypothetical protein OPT61_g7128 [Boeremia exigua]|uniref:Uncharacterized protein n=1 Tax=Boeremia exigua TaxID=749465 RepID=A0ACC2I4R3_9PLEO|nr:hypothetical protein OPT61_g7128 [Boeremia exigua]